MVSMSALHSLTAELHAGFLTLGFVCIIAVTLAQITVRYRNHMPKRLVSAAINVRGYLEATGYVGSIAGLVGLLLSAYTGMYAWPQDILLDNAVVRNKILLTVFSMAFWIGVVYIRTRFGRGLWTCPMMASLYVVLAIVGFVIVATAGSMGAHLGTAGSSILDPLWQAVHLDITKTLAIPTVVAAAIAIISVLAFIVALAVSRNYELFAVKLAPETCSKFFKWDEPVIVYQAPPPPPTPPVSGK